MERGSDKGYTGSSNHEPVSSEHNAFLPWHDVIATIRHQQLLQRRLGRAGLIETDVTTLTLGTDSLALEPVDARGGFVIENRWGDARYFPGGMEHGVGYSTPGMGGFFSEYVSNRHLVLYGDAFPWGLHVRDHGSTNGTYVGGLRSGSIIPSRRNALEYPLIPQTEIVRHPLYTAACAERACQGDETHYMDPVHGVFAVFDGVDNDPYGAVAARYASCEMARWLGFRRPEAGLGFGGGDNELSLMLDHLSQTIPRGNTTGAAVQLKKGRNGRTYANYAAIGDSRIYHLERISERGGYIRQVTVDEGTGNFLARSMGAMQRDTVVADNQGRFPVQAGDSIVILTNSTTDSACSGDQATQAIYQLIQEHPTAEGLAKSLVNDLRAVDSKTAIVLTAE